MIAARHSTNGALEIHQDVDLHASVLEQGHRVALEGVERRRVFLQVVTGAIEVNEQRAAAGDGVQIENEERVTIKALADAEFLLFNLA